MPLPRGVTEAIRCKEWYMSVVYVLTTASVQQNMAGRTYYMRLEEQA
jgi:hypothetical protein